MISASKQPVPLFDPPIVRRAIVDSFRKLDPRVQLRNPVMFVVVGRQHADDRALASTRSRRHGRGQSAGFILAVSLWLWFTVLFANFAEAMAEGRGKAQADTLRKTPHATSRAKQARTSRATAPPHRGVRRTAAATRATSCWSRPATSIPADGEVIEGVASVDESAITGESAPVIRESGGDRSAVTGGTRVLSDWLVVRITRQPGRDLPRPHDRAGRGRQAPEDAERDRARHPARGADDHLPARDA